MTRCNAFERQHDVTPHHAPYDGPTTAANDVNVGPDIERADDVVRADRRAMTVDYRKGKHSNTALKPRPSMTLCQMARLTVLLATIGAI